jgi:hypothetical protein
MASVDVKWLERLDAYLRPFYQDLDGLSRFDEVERVASIARRLHGPAAADERDFELLLRFHLLGTWLEKVGNLSRTSLVTGIAESELRRVASTIHRLPTPLTNAERAVAAAVLIDRGGLRGLAEQFVRGRREGQSPIDIAIATQSDLDAPEWMTGAACAWLLRRKGRRAEACRQIVEELSGEDVI